MYEVGQRVSDIERCPLAKIIEKKDVNGVWWYRLREYAHPHAMWWTDEIHIGPPKEIRHDASIA